MDKLGLKRGINYCFPIKESTTKAFTSKVCDINKEKDCMLELRIDYLLSTGLSIEEIVNYISRLKAKYTQKKLIATIRTYSEGGKVDLPKEKYFYFIKYLYLKSKVHAIDVEYKFYKQDKNYYDELFKKKKKDIIISMHIFSRVLFDYEYNNIFKEMAASSGNIVKFAIMTYNKEDLFTFMEVARKAYSVFKKARKKVVFIAMGDLGKISRLMPKYTNTSIVFLSAYEDEDRDLGIMSWNVYNKYLKLLAKMGKN